MSFSEFLIYQYFVVMTTKIWDDYRRAIFIVRVTNGYQHIKDIPLITADRKYDIHTYIIFNCHDLHDIERPKPWGWSDNHISLFRAFL